MSPEMGMFDEHGVVTTDKSLEAAKCRLS